MIVKNIRITITNLYDNIDNLVLLQFKGTLSYCIILYCDIMCVPSVCFFLCVNTRNCNNKIGNILLLSHSYLRVGKCDWLLIMKKLLLF